MASRRMDVRKLVQLDVIPKELEDDPVIKALCEQTRMSIAVRESLIVVYIQMMKYK